MSSEQVGAEIERLEQAIRAVQKELESLHGAMTSGDAPAEFGAFLDVHWMILTDPTLSEMPKRMIAEQHCNAEWALTQQMGVLVEQFDAIEDPYLRERRADVVQVVERVLKVLLGKPSGVRPANAEEQTILVAHDLSPADVIQFKNHHFAAFLTDLGGVTSHTAIVARSLNVPAVVATHNARTLIRENELLIVDGAKNVVIVNPDRSVLAEYRLKQSEFELERKKLKRLKTTPADDARRRAKSSSSPTSSCPRTSSRRWKTARPASGSSAANSCSSIARDCHPRTSSSRRIARSLTGMEGHAGHHTHLRSRRRQAQGGSRRPRPRRAQSRAGPARRALLPGRAAALPDPAARDPARLALRQYQHPGADAGVRCRDRSDAGNDRAREGQLCASKACRSTRAIKVGGMIEIPAAVLAIGAFTSRLDFLSIGTNDLIQYTLAVDRADEAVSHLYDPLHPAVLKLIAMAITTANKANVPIAVCGEMAGELRLTRLLLGMGLRHFSMHPAHLLDHQAARAHERGLGHPSARRPNAQERRSRQTLGVAGEAQRLTLGAAAVHSHLRRFDDQLAGARDSDIGITE